MYGSVSEATTYFSKRLHSEVWDENSLPEKTKALEHATRLIDNLDFVGEKNASYVKREAFLTTTSTLTTEQEKEVWEAGEAQENQFPRGSDTVVPKDIEEATYELAISLLEGKDPEIEFENQSVIAEGFSSVRDTKDRSFVQEHINAGIPSLAAWSRLRRYLRGRGGISLSRV